MHRPNKRKADVLGNAEDADTGASGSIGGSSSLIGNCYEVFLSFRGPDTRNGFVDHLYHGLVDAGIRVFRDDDELPHGEQFVPDLTAAITNSQILIPVLSVTYGTSSWCLDELVQIMERKNSNGQMVLPIFYEVKPAEVRYQTGRFGEAFRERETRLLERSSFDATILEKWKKALLEVSELKGKEAIGSEAELVKSITREVLNELKKKFELVISKNLVGIDNPVKKIMELLDNKSHAPLFVGIHGMGGIGKTTLAKTIYNQLSNQFEHHSFITDVRESSKNGIHHLQEQLINDILKQTIRVRNQDEGINLLSFMLKDKKILVLLDDVDNIIQVKGMVGNHDWFSSGSKIIITTRNKKILEAAGVDYDYDLKELDYDQSLILFSKHAFRKDSPPSEFKCLTREVVSTIGGLPLSLEVLGSLFSGKELAQWRDTIKKLKKVPRMEVQEKLRISYEALDYEKREIFLDIACSFIGTDRRIASYMWDACAFFPGENIEVLRFMSLIKIESDHVLRMHDQLRDLGREIAQNSSRLWDSKEAQKVLKESKGTNKIKAINLIEGSWKESWKDVKRDGDIYTGEQFKNMTCLRFLQMEGAHLSGDFKNSMEELRWLRWKGCPENFEVTNFHVKELVILELPDSNINEEWEGWRYFMMAEKLKFLDLSQCVCFKNTDFLSAFKNLEVLILNGCWGLKRIDSSIGNMKALIRLDLCGCSRLRELPAEIGELKALEQLLLRDTRALSTLPDSITSLENLEVLDISYSGIEELPEGIGMLRKLRELYAASCISRKVLWSENEFVDEVIRSGGAFSASNLQSLPELPPSLRHLNITCQSRKLPSLSHLVHLKQLWFWDCPSLECIELPSALSKTLECSQLTDVEESELPQSLSTPFELELLEFTRCGSIKTLDVSEHICLRALYIEDCGNLLEVRGIDKLIHLETLGVKGRHSIKQLDLPESKNLKILCVDNCHLAEIKGIDRLEFLKNLSIYHCTSMKWLLLPESKSLKNIYVYHCYNITEIQGIDRLEFLERLSIVRLTSMKRLLLPKSQSLKILCCCNCNNLTEIQGLDGLKFLEKMDISGCTLIERVLLPESRNLKKLDARGCHKLAEIEGLNGLEFLEELDIFMCTSIKRLEFSKSGRLKRLVADRCENLAEIQGPDTLEFLRIVEYHWKTNPNTNLSRKTRCIVSGHMENSDE